MHPDVSALSFVLYAWFPFNVTSVVTNSLLERKIVLCWDLRCTDSFKFWLLSNTFSKTLWSSLSEQCVVRCLPIYVKSLCAKALVRKEELGRRGKGNVLTVCQAVAFNIKPAILVWILEEAIFKFAFRWHEWNSITYICGKLTLKELVFKLVWILGKLFFLHQNNFIHKVDWDGEHGMLPQLYKLLELFWSFCVYLINSTSCVRDIL